MIIKIFGEKFVEFPQFNMQRLFKESTPFKPIIFILSTGSDPKTEVDTLCIKEGIADKLLECSMGQG